MVDENKAKRQKEKKKWKRNARHCRQMRQVEMELLFSRNQHHAARGYTDRSQSRLDMLEGIIGLKHTLRCFVIGSRLGLYCCCYQTMDYVSFRTVMAVPGHMTSETAGHWPGRAAQTG